MDLYGVEKGLEHYRSTQTLTFEQFIFYLQKEVNINIIILNDEDPIIYSMENSMQNCSFFTNRHSDCDTFRYTVDSLLKSEEKVLFIFPY